MFFIGFFSGIIFTVSIGAAIKFYRSSNEKDRLLARLSGVKFEEGISTKAIKD